MPLIAYQSFNSNSSTTHDLKSISYQNFTCQTNRRILKAKREALVLPMIKDNLVAPVEGPANLVPIQPIDKKRKVETDDEMSVDDQSSIFGSQIALAWQNFNRAFGEMPAIMVCGEMDSSNGDFTAVIKDDNVTLKALPAKKACQSFTAISRNAVGATFIKSGEGFVAYAVNNLNVVFVHVPNEIATKKEATQSFYKNIAQNLLSSGKIIHLVIGDTNQSSANFTKDVLNTAFSTDQYVNALEGKTIKPIDYFQTTESGTNSNAKKLFDVAVYRADLVKLTKDVAYLSQSSNAITVTDHCGIGVCVELK